MTENEKSVCEKKSKFIQLYIAPMVKALDDSIDAVRYRVYDNGTETVILTFCGGFVRHIDVTADSLTALARDVLAKI